MKGGRKKRPEESRVQERMKGGEKKEVLVVLFFLSLYYLIRNQHQPHKPPNRKNMQRRTVIETGLLQTWDLHKGVVLGAYHQENTRKKAEVEKDDFYFQEGNGLKKSWLNLGRLPHWEGPQDCGKVPSG